MTGVRVTVDDRELQDALRALARLGRDPSGPMKAVGVRMVATTRNRLRQGITPQGSAFAPLNPDYARTAGRGGILRRLGMGGGLMGSIVSEAEGGTRVRIGTNKVYSAIHQFGGTIRPRGAGAMRFRLGERWVFAKSVTIPARPYLGISAEDREEILDVFGAFMQRATHGAVRPG